MITDQIDIITQLDLSDLKNYIVTNNLTNPTIQFNPAGATVQFEPHELFKLDVSHFSLLEKKTIRSWLDGLKPSIGEDEKIIFGADPTTHVTSIEARDGAVEIFREVDGVVSSEVRQNRFWLLAPRPYDRDFRKLDGNLHYKFIKYYDNKRAFMNDKNKYRSGDTYSVADGKESYMILNGLTYYKGMKVNDVSRFHFDLETTGFLKSSNNRVLLISTTYINRGVVKKRLFACDEYEDDATMLLDFCDYVRECDPSIFSGFNIYGFDLPYLKACADELGIDLPLGRDGSTITFSKYPSKFRKDGSQTYDYFRCFIYGREIVDMMFVAYHYDYARKYESYGLKSIIKQEGLEREGRQFYDASTIHKNWDIPAERAKIKGYCIDDSDDNDSLFTLMISSYFYFSQSIPKSFQSLNYSATGSQLNSLLVRSYLQLGHSIPKADEAERFEGAISNGYPGIYKNVFKVDVASLYPSIMLQYEVYHPEKDPKRHFLKMVQFFTTQRLKNKKLGKETGDRYYKDVEQSQKIGINSAFGLLGAQGLNFNFPNGAATITSHGRNILKTAVKWATGKDYIENDQKNA